MFSPTLRLPEFIKRDNENSSRRFVFTPMDNVNNETWNIYDQIKKKTQDSSRSTLQDTPNIINKYWGWKQGNKVCIIQ